MLQAAFVSDLRAEAGKKKTAWLPPDPMPFPYLQNYFFDATGWAGACACALCRSGLAHLCHYAGRDLGQQ